MTHSVFGPDECSFSHIDILLGDDVRVLFPGLLQAFISELFYQIRGTGLLIVLRQLV